jgi:hypothetical protein
MLPTTTTAPFRPDMELSLIDRISRLDSCAGYWSLDLRDPKDPRGHDAHYLCQGISLANYGTIKSPEVALSFCRDHHWRGCRLLFSPTKLNADCSWPGGYSAPSVYRSNNRVFQGLYSKELALADGEHDGLALDVRFLSLEMIETIESLESYCVLDDDDLSELELADQAEAWDNWAASDWRREVERAIDDLLPDGLPFDADDLLNRTTDDALEQLFRECCEVANAYWFEDGGYGQFIDVDKVAAKLTSFDLEKLTGLPLIALSDCVLLDESDQQSIAVNNWRCEPYPWLGADPAPLILTGDDQ